MEATPNDWEPEAGDDPRERPRRPLLLDDDWIERGAALDGLKLQVRSQQFRGGRLTAVLSGVTLDLRDAALSPDGATISVQAAMSGIDILVPRDWPVQCDVDGVCGAIGDERAPRAPGSSGPRLRVTGMVVAGGLSVR